MLELRVVEKSHSSLCSPVLLVKKSNRFCFERRKLNSITKSDSYPLPAADRILSMLRQPKFISSVDLKSDFWQIPLTNDNKEKTAFTQFTVLLFDLSNSTQCMQQVMDVVFGPELEPNVFVYLDDIIIISSTFEEHIELLNEVRNHLRGTNLTINLDKCKFFR